MRWFSLKTTKTVTIRLNQDKTEVYDEYRDLIINKLHSDVCYVTTELMELFVKSVRALPNEPANIQLQFFKQHVQINMGCTLNYEVRKKRREPPTETVTYDKNRFFPTLIEQWPTMTEKSKQFWRSRLIESGIMPDPYVSTGKRKSLMQRIKSFMVQCKTIVCSMLGWKC